MIRTSARGPLRTPIAERFWSRVVKMDGGCWLYGGEFYGNQYGTLSRGGPGSANVAAHRFSYELHHGPIPVGQFVCHRCDVKNCVNPEHLYAGTHEDNTRDIVERKRTAKNTARVVRVPGRRYAYGRALDRTLGDQLIAEYATGNWTQAQLALRYRMAQCTVSQYLRRRSKVPADGLKTKRTGFFRRRLRVEQYDEICELYLSGKFTQQHLAERFGCDQTYISTIVRARRNDDADPDPFQHGG